METLAAIAAVTFAAMMVYGVGFADGFSARDKELSAKSEDK